MNFDIVLQEKEQQNDMISYVQMLYFPTLWDAWNQRDRITIIGMLSE